MSDNRVKSNVNDKMIEETARDYAAYLQVDLPSQTGGVHEAVDEMLIRLEEFESIVGMVQNLRAECTFEHLVRFRSVHPALMELCRRIDALEHVVARASVDLVSLETAVEAAEAELGGNATVSDRLFGILNPLSLFVRNLCVIGKPVGHPIDPALLELAVGGTGIIIIMWVELVRRGC